MKKFKLGWIGVVAVLAVAAMLSPALAFEAKLSGQVNHMVMWADDGDKDDFFITDNNNSSTRIRFKGEEELGKIKAGIYVEIEAVRNSSNKLTIGQNGDGAFAWEDRWLEAYFDTPFGKIQLGKGDGAANNSAEVDLSGTDVITKSDINATAGAFVWRNSDGSAYRDGLTVAKTRDNFDGLSRNERLRYNTPAFFGITLSSSVTNGDALEAAVTYAAEFYGKMAAAIGYIDTQNRSTDRYSQLGMSVSWLAPFGLNLTAAYGQRCYDEDDDSEDPTNYYVKVGYKTGIHALSIDYGQTLDLAADEDTSTNIGAAYVITPWKPVEFYAAVRQYMLDTDGDDDPEDIKQIMAGTRIKF